MGSNQSTNTAVGPNDAQAFIDRSKESVKFLQKQVIPDINTRLNDVNLTKEAKTALSKVLGMVQDVIDFAKFLVVENFMQNHNVVLQHVALFETSIQKIKDIRDKFSSLIRITSEQVIHSIIYISLG